MFLLLPMILISLFLLLLLLFCCRWCLLLLLVLLLLPYFVRKVLPPFYYFWLRWPPSLLPAACCLQLSRGSFYLYVFVLSCFAFLLFCWFCNCLTEIGWERILFVLHGKMNLNAWIQNVTWTKTLCKEFLYNYYVLFFRFFAFRFSFFRFFYIG